MTVKFKSSLHSLLNVCITKSSSICPYMRYVLSKSVTVKSDIKFHRVRNAIQKYVKKYQNCEHNTQLSKMNQLPVSTFRTRWHYRARKGPYAFSPDFQQSPQNCLRNKTNLCVIKYRYSRPQKMERRPLRFSAPFSFKRPMLCPVHGQKVLQASEHL